MKIVVVLLVFTVCIGLFMEVVAVTNDTQTNQETGNSHGTAFGGPTAKTTPKPGPGEGGCPKDHVLRAKKCRKVTRA